MQPQRRQSSINSRLIRRNMLVTGLALLVASAAFAHF